MVAHDLRAPLNAINYSLDRGIESSCSEQA